MGLRPPITILADLPAASATVAIAATVAVFARFGLIHLEVAAHELGPVQGRDRLRGLLVVAHFDEAEAFGLAGEFVADYRGTRDCSNSGKEFVQMLVGHRVSEIADV